MKKHHATANRILRRQRLEVKTLLKPVVVEALDAKTTGEAINKLLEYISVLDEIRNALLDSVLPEGTVIMDDRKCS